MTSVNSPPTGLLPMELPLTRSAEGSRARTSQTLVSRLALRVSEAVSGPNMRASLANFDPVSSSWRTSQRCLVEGWTVFSETWPRSGMMRSGIAYQLQPLAPLTEGTDSGWLPTPRAMDGRGAQSGTKTETLLRRASSGFGPNLPEAAQMMARGLWPTPRASAAGPDFAKVGRSATGISLATAVAMWPTPSARDWKDNPGAWMWNGKNPDGTHRNRTDQLPRKVYAVEGTAQNGGQLNPTWVEWLMGFPTGHTDLRHSETP